MFIHYIFQLLFKKSRQQKVAKPLHPPTFHLCSHHYHFLNIWMFNHPHTTKYHLFCDFLMLGDKIFHCVVWKKFLHLPVKLRRQRLIVCNDQRRFVQLLNNICHSKCLTGTCDSKQRLELIALLEAFDQFLNCLRLVTGWFVFGMKFEDLL